MLKTDLRCGGCDKPLGDNNDEIETGPHAGYLPTDLTTHCEKTGRQERVIDASERYQIEDAIARGEILIDEADPPLQMIRTSVNGSMLSPSEYLLANQGERVRAWADGPDYREPPKPLPRLE